MKKSLFLIAILAVSVSAFGCVFLSAQNNLVSFTMLKSNGTIPPQYQFEEKIVLVPNYATETLKMNYSKIYPYREAETVEQDVSSEAEIGNDYFVQFQNITELLKDENIYKVETVGCTGGSTIDIEQVFEDGTAKKGSFYLCGELGENIKTVEGFYGNLVKTVSEDVY